MAHRSTADIDADFENPEKKMDLRWDGEKWTWTHEDWYDFLDITPEYLIEKCRAKGINADDALRAWGTLLHNRPSSRPPRPIEKLGTKVRGVEVKYNEHIWPLYKKAILDYHNTVDKEAARNSLQNCNINAAKLETKERLTCQSNVICRPDIPGERRHVDVDADYDIVEASDMPEAKKVQYRRCRVLGETCKNPDIGTQYNADDFTYIKNGGSGDCLFIAVQHYINIATALGVYPEPGQGLNEVLTLSSTAVLVGPAAELRAQVCEYFRTHPNNILLPGRSTNEELSALNLEGHLYHSDADYRRQYNFYVLSLRANNVLGLRQIPATEKDPKNSPAIREAMSILQSDVPAEQEAAWLHFQQAMARNYITQMSKASTYGGSAEIAALSQILRKNIHVLQHMEGAHNMLEANMGFVYSKSPDTDNMYIYHNASVQGAGSLHFEIMFPMGQSEEDRYGTSDAESDTDADTASEPPGVHEISVFLVTKYGMEPEALQAIREEDVLDALLQTIAADDDFDTAELFQYNFHNMDNEVIFSIFDEEPSSVEKALQPAPSGAYDLVATKVLKGLYNPDFLVKRYKQWFDRLTHEEQTITIYNMAHEACEECDISSYDPTKERTPAGYNENAEARLTLYTGLMPAVYKETRTPVEGITPQKSMYNCMATVARILQEELGIADDLPADVSGMIERVLFLKEALVEAEASDSVRNAIEELQYQILICHASMTPILMMLSAVDGEMVYEPYIPDEDTTLERALELVSFMDSYIDVMEDPGAS